METEHIVALLIAERDRLSRAIDALQGGAKRRGRPPGASTKPLITSTPASVAVPKPVKRKMSAAGRRAIAEGVRRRWAAIRAGKKK